MNDSEVFETESLNSFWLAIDVQPLAMMQTDSSAIIFLFIVTIFY